MHTEGKHEKKSFSIELITMIHNNNNWRKHERIIITKEIKLKVIKNTLLLHTTEHSLPRDWAKS